MISELQYLRESSGELDGINRDCADTACFDVM